jgi:DNA primase
LFESRESLRKSDSIFLVEGYVDVIALHDAGVDNAVATCGTALTVDQARLLKRFAGDVVTLFDGDRAGLDAAARSFPVFVGVGIWPKGVFLPEGEDPDSYVRELGAERFREAVKQAVPLVDAYTRRVVEGMPAGTGGAAKAGSELAAVLARVADPFEYDVLVRKSALWTGLSEDMLRAQGHKLYEGRSRAAPPKAMARGGAPGSEELLVSLMLSEPAMATRVAESGVVALMQAQSWKLLADSIVERVASHRSVDTGDLLETLNDADRARVAARLNEGVLDDPEAREKILGDCIKGIERTARRRHNLEIVTDMRQKEELGHDVASDKILKRWKPSGAPDA